MNTKYYESKKQIVLKMKISKIAHMSQFGERQRRITFLVVSMGMLPLKNFEKGYKMVHSDKYFEDFPEFTNIKVQLFKICKFSFYNSLTQESAFFFFGGGGRGGWKGRDFVPYFVTLCLLLPYPPLFPLIFHPSSCLFSSSRLPLVSLEPDSGL